MSSEAGEEIYKIVGSFSQYKKQIEKFLTIEDDPWISMCDGSDTPLIPYPNEENINICPVAMRYIGHVLQFHHDHLIDKGCKFLYYWLYYKYLNEKKSSDDTFKLYSALLDISNFFNQDIDEKHKVKINENILKKLKDLDDMNDKLNSIINKNAPDSNYCKCAKDCASIYMTHQSTCSKSNYNNFCHELENIRTQYNSLVNTIENCDAENLLPSFNGYNPIVTVLIPLVAILLMSFTLFILYKVNNSFS